MHLWGSSEAPAGGEKDASQSAPKDSKRAASQHEEQVDARGSALAERRGGARRYAKRNAWFVTVLREHRCSASGAATGTTRAGRSPRARTSRLDGNKQFQAAAARVGNRCLSNYYVRTALAAAPPRTRSRPGYRNGGPEVSIWRKRGTY